MPTGHRKLEKLSELLGKAIEKLSQMQYRFTVTTNSNGNAMAYPALRTTKEDDDVDFSFFLLSTLFTSDQAEALEHGILLHSVRWAQNVFLCHESLSRMKPKNETLNSRLLEKT